MAAKNKRIQLKQDRVTIEGVVLEHQREAMGVVLSMSTAILFLSLVSFKPDDPVLQSIGNRPVNLVGLVGAYLANGLLAVLGLMSFFVAFVLGWAAMAAFGFKLARPSVKNVVGALALLLQGAVLCHLAWSGRPVFGHPAGGALGEAVSGLLVSLFSGIGTALICSGGLMLSLVAILGISPSRAVVAVVVAARVFFLFSARHCAAGAVVAGRASWRFAKAASAFLLREARELMATLRKSEATQAVNHAEVVSGHCLPEELESGDGEQFIEPCEMASSPPALLPPEPVVVTGEIPTPVDEPAPSGIKSFRDVSRTREPEIVIPQLEPALPLEAENQEASRGSSRQTMDLSDYRLPQLDLLEMQPQDQTEIEKDLLQQYARRLEEKLANYGVDGHVTKIMPGPVVTMYEYVPADGVKVSKIAGLSNDLALALGATSVRIVAPIPGRTVVGI